MGVKFGAEEGIFGPLLRAKFHPIGATCRPFGTKNLKNRPLSKLNTGWYALRAMLPVKIRLQNISVVSFFHICG